MNKQEAIRRVDKCIRKTSDIITIRAVESGKQEDKMSDWELDMASASDEVEQSGKHGQPIASAPASVEDKILPPNDFPIDGKKWNDLSKDEQWQEYRNTRVERDKLQAENARLQGDLAAAQAIIVQAGADMQALRDENARLRNGLEIIVYGKELEWLKANPNVKSFDDHTARRVASIFLHNTPIQITK